MVFFLVFQVQINRHAEARKVSNGSKIDVLKQIWIFGSKCCAVKGIVILRSAEREDYLGLGRAMHQAYTYTTLKPSLLPTPYPTFLPPTPRSHSDLDSFQKTSFCSSSLILRPLETTSRIHLILQNIRSDLDWIICLQPTQTPGTYELYSLHPMWHILSLVSPY